jgi:hypothetical protein
MPQHADRASAGAVGGSLSFPVLVDLMRLSSSVRVQAYLELMSLNVGE